MDNSVLILLELPEELTFVCLSYISSKVVALVCKQWENIFRTSFQLCSARDLSCEYILQKQYYRRSFMLAREIRRRRMNIGKWKLMIIIAQTNIGKHHLFNNILLEREALQNLVS